MTLITDMKFAVIGLLTLAFGVSVPASDDAGLLASPGNDYTHSCWLNGLRKTKADTSPTLFAIETSRYGFCLDLADFGKAGFGPKPGKAPGYAGSLEAGTDWLRVLPPASLVFEVELDGKPYRALQCRAGLGNVNERFKYVRMWESGRFVQHFDFLDLELRDTAGVVLPCQASLDLVAWPESLTLTARIVPGAGSATSNSPAWKNVKCRVGVRGPSIDCFEERIMEDGWRTGETHELTVTHNMVEPIPFESVGVNLTFGGSQQFPAVFDPRRNCLVSTVSGLKRTFKTGYTDIRQYDDFLVSVENPGTGGRVIPFLLNLRDVANITGLCPVLCDNEGRPTGIPVQLSKNWHSRELGAYLMAYALLPVKPGKNEYLLRIVYGFYGTLPSASHAQLSLVGYGNSNGRWDQLAIGCWGETFCFDMDMTCVDNVVTDVRGLMFRNGVNGKKWGWTDAGWGGDWLGIKDAWGSKLPFSGMRTAYLAHGPCMSEVRHAGFYGAGREVALEVQVRTVRADDYARTFQTLKYTFQSDIAAKDAWLHKLSGSFITPKVAYGNRDGLLAEYVVCDYVSALTGKTNCCRTRFPEGERVEFAVGRGKTQAPRPLRVGEARPTRWKRIAGQTSREAGACGTGETGTDASSPLPGRISLTGDAPWWVAFPGATSPEAKDWGTGYRALIIRSYKAVVGGKKVSRPTLALPVGAVRKDGPCLELLLVVPEGVERFRPGDSVEMDLEWITLPRCADDYCGPNEAFRKHLAENPSSWKTTYREAIANDLGVRVSGGKLLSRYPIVIKARSSAAKVMIKGGVGCVPIRFEGLETANGYTLYQVVDGKEIKFDQSVHGNDFWQADYNEAGGTYQLTYNLPMDDKRESVWVLRLP